MKITITDEWIYVEDCDLPLTERGRVMGVHSCRTVSHEACAWAIKRLGTELEKSVAYYRTGDAEDSGQICMG